MPERDGKMINETALQLFAEGSNVLYIYLLIIFIGFSVLYFYLIYKIDRNKKEIYEILEENAIRLNRCDANIHTEKSLLQKESIKFTNWNLNIEKRLNQESEKFLIVIKDIETRLKNLENYLK